MITYQELQHLSLEELQQEYQRLTGRLNELSDASFVPKRRTKMQEVTQMLHIIEGFITLKEQEV